jgi:hypothetical protein
VFSVVMRRPRTLVLLAMLSGASTAAGAVAAHAATPVRGLSDDLAFTDSRSGPRALAFETARRAGARVVRITLDWSLVAPAGEGKPAGFDAADPNDPAYRWGYVEDAVRDARRERLGVVLVVVRAPRWAEGPGRPAGAPAGAWRPDPAELGAFVRATARRFSGFFPDPKVPGDGLTTPGGSLPRVRFWQIWDHPNSPGGLQPADAAVEHYRQMLRSASSAAKRVAQDNVVVAGATSPAGRIAPLPFWRRLLSRRVRFDVAAHSGASTRGRGLGKLAQVRMLRRLLARAGRRRPVWLTDLGWATRPQDPRGVSPARQARLLTEALRVADQARVALVVWNGLQDRSSHLPGFASIASGLFFNHKDNLARDPAKPALRAYRFPFLVRRAGRSASAWGIAPRPRGRVSIERRVGGRWRRAEVVRASRSGEFRATERSGRWLYRARQGRARSLPWRSD